MDVNKLLHFVDNDCVWDGHFLINKKTKRKVKAIIPVHILGHPVDMDPIIEIAKKFALVVIEDATESLGAFYKGKPVGSFGEMACFSFNGNKLITTGGGGMLVTHNEKYARQARYLTTQAKDEPIEFIHNNVGYNYRLTNIQAAMGCAQLELLESFIEVKKRIAEQYCNAFSKVEGITPMREAPWARSVWWLYTILIDEEIFGLSSREVLAELLKNGIETRPLWQPLHRSPAHVSANNNECPVADRLNKMAISLPCSASLSKEEQSFVISSILNLSNKQ